MLPDSVWGLISPELSDGSGYGKILIERGEKNKMGMGAWSMEGVCAVGKAQLPNQGHLTPTIGQK